MTTTTFTQQQLKEFEQNQWTLAVFAPGDKSWNELKNTSGIKINPFLKSSVFRVIFAIVSFIFIIPRIAMGEKIKLSSDGEKRSGYQLAQIFANRRSFSTQPQATSNQHAAQIPANPLGHQNLSSSPSTNLSKPQSKQPTKNQPLSDEKKPIKSFQGSDGQPSTNDGFASSVPLQSTSSVRGNGSVESKGDIGGKLVLRRGLPNGNNSCYLNAGVQLIASIPQMYELFKGGESCKLKDALINLVDALNNPSSKESRINRLKNIFYNALLNDPDWKNSSRGGYGTQNDTIEVLQYLESRLKVNLSTISPVTTREESIVTSLSHLDLPMRRKEKISTESSVRLYLDNSKTNFIDSLNQVLDDSEEITYHLSNNREDIGSEISSREVLFNAVLSLPADTTSKNRMRRALLREFDDGNGRNLSDADFREGTQKYNTIVRNLGVTYEVLLDSYIKSAIARGAYINKRVKKTHTTPFADSRLFMVTIEVRDSKQRVQPPLALTIHGIKYRLKAAVQRPYASTPNGGHYTCCELSENGKSLSNYDDSNVKLHNDSPDDFANFLREARCIVYERQ
jgi:hypothetical protein